MTKPQWTLNRSHMLFVMAAILGMGLPATAVHLILATLVTPSLEKLGVLPMAAHMFVFYYGIISTITPPVALTSYAAAGVGGGNPNRTGYYAFYLGIASFIIPFVLAYAPELLLVGSPPAIAYRFAVTLFAVYIMASSLTGYFRRPLETWRRAVLAVAALLLIVPHPAFDIVGIAVSAVLLAPIAVQHRKVANNA